MTESLRIHPLSAAHTPGKEGEGLNVVAHAATAEVHAPREDGLGGEGSRRPVEGEGRLHIAKGMAGGESWVALGRVYQARQLLDRRKAPALAITDAQLVALTLSTLPGEARRARRLLPDEP